MTHLRDKLAFPVVSAPEPVAPFCATHQWMDIPEGGRQPVRVRCYTCGALGRVTGGGLGARTIQEYQCLRPGCLAPARTFLPQQRCMRSGCPCVRVPLVSVLP